jgi:hypothetical protein
MFEKIAEIFISFRQRHISASDRVTARTTVQKKFEKFSHFFAI